MRIGLLAPPHSEDAGGGFTYVSMIFDAIRGFDFRAEIIVLDFREIDYFPEDLISGEVDIGTDYPAAVNIRFTRSLNHHLRLHKVDLVWLVTPSTIVVPCIPFVMTVWDLAHRQFPFFPEVSTQGWTWQQRESYFQTLLPRASYILTGTVRGASEIKTCYGIPDERIRVIPLPAPRPAFENPDAPMPFKGRYLFYPAQFWAHKNHLRAIRALRLLREDETYSDLHLVFVGSDQANEGFIRQMVDDEGMACHVHFLGFVGRDAVEVLYRNAEALLYLSFFGPDNLPPLEALSFNCPVVLSDHPGHREQLADAAVFVNPLDERAIADGVRQLSPELRTRLAIRGQEIIASRRIEMYLSAVRDVFEEFQAYQASWPAPSSQS